ncbi:hypothetical protein SAMN05880558_105154 [Aeromonas sp. RU39B]|nr:hypothetical protein SAMN05880558_105154 [Aeromonas sp. RU39B]
MGSLWPQAWHEAPSLLLVESVHRLDDKMMNLKKFTDVHKTRESGFRITLHMAILRFLTDKK